jgi:catechol 2,3-dioxygenase-like lactoylglutathione lyase family enzyme
MTEAKPDPSKRRATKVGWLRGVIFDAADPAALAEFWCGMLGVELNQKMCQPPAWYETHRGDSGVVLGFQPVPSDRGAGNGAPTPRLRLDIEVPELDEPTAKAIELGARLLDVVRFRPGEEHRVFADPEGNEFNLVLPFPPDADS